MGYITKIPSTVVGHGMMFEISPNALDGVHVGGVGRQVVDRDLPALSLDMRLHELERWACRRSQMMSSFLPIVVCKALRNSTICGLSIEPLNRRK